MGMKGSVVQQWVTDLPSFMLQSVLLCAIRGPDTLPKEHVAKALCRWLRRCVLISAFDGVAVTHPGAPGGGSFTGPSIGPLPLHSTLDDVLDAYLSDIDAVPLHFHLHLMHATEILGYKHPHNRTRGWWHRCYCRIVADMHLYPEPESALDLRLSDNEADWRAEARRERT
jgi:hypothetical protein